MKNMKIEKGCRKFGWVDNKVIFISNTLSGLLLINISTDITHPPTFPLINCMFYDMHYLILEKI